MEFDVSIPNFSAHHDREIVSLRSECSEIDGQVITIEAVTAVNQSDSRDSLRLPPPSRPDSGVQRLPPPSRSDSSVLRLPLSSRSDSGVQRLPSFNRSRRVEGAAAVPTANNRMCLTPKDPEPAVRVGQRTLLLSNNIVILKPFTCTTVCAYARCGHVHVLPVYLYDIFVYCILFRAQL